MEWYNSVAFDFNKKKILCGSLVFIVLLYTMSRSGWVTVKYSNGTQVMDQL
jgi:hypothetical protein